MHVRVLIIPAVTSSLALLRELEAGGRVGSNASLFALQRRGGALLPVVTGRPEHLHGQLHCSAAPGQADLIGVPGQHGSCCSLLRALSSGWSTPLLPAPVQPQQGRVYRDAKTTEVRASGVTQPRPGVCGLSCGSCDGRPSVPVQLGERLARSCSGGRAMT